MDGSVAQDEISPPRNYQSRDLALADADELKQVCQPVHFTETIEVGGDGAAAGMSFDYQLRPGVATSTNALRLLELMGIRDRQAPRHD